MKKYLFLFFFIPILSFSQQRDYKNFDRAVKHNVKGNIEKAIKYANKALKNSPEWMEPNLLLASIYSKQGEIQLAVDYLLKVYDKDNAEDIKGLEEIFKLYYSNGFYVEALFYAKNIMRLDSNRYDLNYYIESCDFALEAIKNPVSFKPENLGVNINSEYAEYLPAISVDDKTLVYSRRIVKNNILQEDFFISNKAEDKSWKRSSLYGNHLNTYGNEGAFSFSVDKKMAVFTACDREDRIGRCDLYLLINGKTYNAGPVVNSKQWDSQGCFSPDGKYLYFVSNRKGGVGGKDIWRSEITKYGFLEPENLGPTINTKKNEVSPFLHPDNLTFYFASDGHVGMGDYDMYFSRRNNTQDEWKFVENMGYPINTHNVENSLVVSSDGKTAYYTSNNSGFGLEDIFIFELPERTQAHEVSALELDIITKEIGEEVVLKNVIFPSNSFEIDTSSFLELDRLIIYLHKNPHIEIEIQGHTDNIGTEFDNQLLSERRAKVVFEYLRERVENRLSYKGYGESKPLFSNDLEQGRMFNRRTSFVIQ